MNVMASRAHLSAAPVGQARRAGPTGGVTLGMLLALAAAAMGIGFASFTYTVPYRRALKQKKMLRGELMSAQAQASARQRELEHLRKDLAVQVGSPDDLVRVRSEMSIMNAKINQLAGTFAPGAMTSKSGMRTLLVRFSEDALFDARGPAFTAPGQASLQSLGEIIGNRASRVLVTAPYGDSKPARWVADNYPTAEDLAMARVRTAVQVLQTAITPADAVWGVSSGGPVGQGEPTLDIEIHP